MAHVMCAETREIASVFPSMYCTRDGRHSGEGLRCSRYHKPCCFCRKYSGNSETVSCSSWYAVDHFPLSIRAVQQFEHGGTVLENSCRRGAHVRNPQNIYAVE